MELMTPENKKLLRSNWNVLVDNLEVKDLLIKLRKSFTDQQLLEIKSKPTTPEQAECLLEKLLKRPNETFGCFVRALDETKQEHLSKLLKAKSTESDVQDLERARNGVDNETALNSPSVQNGWPIWIRPIFCDPFEERLERLMQMKKQKRIIVTEGNSIEQMAWLNDELFVICEGTTEIEVYDIDASALLRRIKVPGLKNPAAIEIHKLTNSIYILDSIKCCVFRVVLDSGKVTQWPVYSEARWLSVDEDNNIKVRYSSSAAQTFTPEGYFIKESQSLRESVSHIQSMVSISCGQVLVTHGGPQHRVCKVDDSGTIIESYGSYPGSSTGHLSYPRGLAVTANGHVLVADRDNNRVLLLSPSLKFIRELISADSGLHGPQALCLVEEKGILFVGEKTGRLLEFQIGEVKDRQAKKRRLSSLQA